jgi:hypothetical protein
MIGMMERGALEEYSLSYHTNFLLLSPPERYNNSEMGNGRKP